jgi:hypothetical protein
MRCGVRVAIGLFACACSAQGPTPPPKSPQNANSQNREVEANAKVPSTPSACTAAIGNRLASEWLPRNYQSLIAWPRLDQPQPVESLANFAKSAADKGLALPLILDFTLRNLQLEVDALTRSNFGADISRAPAWRLATTENEAVWFFDQACDREALRTLSRQKAMRFVALDRGFILAQPNDSAATFDWFSPDGLLLAACPRGRAPAVLSWFRQQQLSDENSLNASEERERILAIEASLRRGGAQVVWQGRHLTPDVSPKSQQPDSAVQESPKLHGLPSTNDKALTRWIALEDSRIIVDGQDLGSP